MSASIWSPDGTIPSEAPPDYVYKRIWIDIAVGQTLVNFASVDPTFVYTPGLQSLEVGIDGAMPLQPVVDYTETSPSSITLISPPTDAGRLYAAVGRPINVSPSGVTAALVPYTFPDGTVRAVQDLATPIGSTGVGYIASGAGAVARTVQAKERQIVSIADFMSSTEEESVRARNLAVDVTAAGLLAFSAVAAAGGGAVYGISGDYKLTAEWGLSTSGVEFIGAGRYSTLLVQHTMNSKTLNVSAPYCGAKSFSIRYGGTPTSGGTAIYCNNASYFSASDFMVRNSHIAIEYTNSVAGKLTDFDLLDYESIGLYAHVFNDLFVRGAIINAGNTTRGALGGIRLFDKAEAFNCSDVDVIYGVYSMTTDATVNGLGTRPAYNRFANCYFDSAVNGVVIDKAVEFDWTGCWFSNRPENGLVLAAVNGMHFNGGGAINCAKHGVYVGGSAVNVTFNNFRSRGNSTAAANTYDGIFFDGTTDWQVNGGVYDAGLSFGAQRYGINIGAACDRFAVVGPNVRNNTTAGILDSSSASAEKSIRAVGYRTVNSGTGTVLNGQTVVTITHGLAATPRAQDIAVAFAENSVANGVTSLFLASIGATTFQIVTNTAATGDLDVTWTARIKGA